MPGQTMNQPPPATNSKFRSPPGPPRAGSSATQGQKGLPDDVLQSARRILPTRNVRSWAELQPAERVKLDTVSAQAAQDIKDHLLQLDPQVTSSICDAVVQVIVSSGNEALFDLRRAETLDINRVYRALIVPFNPGYLPHVFGADSRDSARGYSYTFTFAHGTSIKSASIIAAEALLRPSAWGGILEGPDGSYPTMGFNAQATPGSYSTRAQDTAAIVLGKVLKTPKGLQGVVVLGETFSKVPHYSTDSQCVDEEQRITALNGSCKGVHRWTLHAECSHITAFAFIRAL